MGIFRLVQSFDDFDDFIASITWDLKYTQLSPGKFRADLAFFGDRDLQIAEVSLNTTLLQNGSVPEGFTFAIHHPESAPLKWRHLDFGADGIIVFPESREHQGLSQENHHPFTMTITDTYLSKVADEVGLPEPSEFVRKGEIHQCDPVTIRRIQHFLGSVCEMIRFTPAGFVKDLVSHEFKWKIARMFLLALSSSEVTKLRKRRLSRRKRIVDRVMEYIDSDLATVRSVPELCRIAEVSERTLRNVFYEQVSLSPTRFLKCHRLNTVRSALKRLDSTEALVADIANETGFWHMGQFAGDYRRLFEELPSETLARRSKGQATSKLSTEGFDR